MAPDALAATICDAAERYCGTSNICLTRKRLLKEFLAHPDLSGRTLSGLVADGFPAAASGSPSAQPDLVYIVRKWMGYHIIKHYYVMRQYREASEVVLGFLKFLQAEAVLPAAMAKDLDAAVEIGETGVQQLPGIFRIIKQPCYLNEAWSYAYQLRPFPLAMTTCSAECKESTSRMWPATAEQSHHAWLSFISERCRVEIDELQSILDAIPKGLSIKKVHEGRWQVLAVRPDHTLVFCRSDGSQQCEIRFSAQRAADLLPGMMMVATFVELSNGHMFATDWGYTYPNFYAPLADHKEDFGSRYLTPLVY